MCDIFAFYAWLYTRSRFPERFNQTWVLNLFYLLTNWKSYFKKITFLTTTDSKPQSIGKRSTGHCAKEIQTHSGCDSSLFFFQPANCFNAHHRTRPVICCHPVASYMLQMVLECVQLKEFIVGLSGCSTSQPRTIWRGTCATAGYDARATVKPV